MNKADFLHIVRQVAPIRDQEVEDLEKLVVSFPYCQTAHVLLAKAAYDRGSMLSTQKLRRAAAHVSNRQLLKKLVYAPSSEFAQTSLSQGASTTAQPPSFPLFSEKEEENTPVLLLSPTSPEREDTDTVTEEIAFEEVDAESTQVLHELEQEDFEPTVSEFLPIEVQEEVNSLQTAEPEFIEHKEGNETLFEDSSEKADSLFSYDAEKVENVSTSNLENNPLETEAVNTQGEIPESVSETDDAPLLIDKEVPYQVSPEDELLDLIQISGLVSFTAPIPSVDLTHEEIISEIVSTTDAKLQAEKAEEQATYTYRLEEEQEVLSPEPEKAEPAPLSYTFPTLQATTWPVATETEATEDPFLSIFMENSLAYSMGSSRLGESLQLKNELTSALPTVFQPALILEHVKGTGSPLQENTKPPVAKLDIQLDIINQFLKATPRRKTLANVQQNTEPQEDLSAKSTKIKKNLVSENLAQIFVKQGKTKKAVKIYEQLIVKFPEKKSYFAQQIEKLRNEY